MAIVLSLFILVISLAYAGADKEIIPKLHFYDNPVAQAWSEEEDIEPPIAPEQPGLLNVKLPKSFNYERAASWYPGQTTIALRSYFYLLKNGIDEDSGLWKKFTLGIGFTLGYEYRVEPSFYDKLYTRIDRFSMRPEFSFKKTLLEMKDYQARSVLNPGFELEYRFYRQFKDPKIALLSTPYNERNLPFDAKHAIKGMKPGDLFSFRAALNILFDTSVITDLATKHLAISAGAHVLLRGMFDVYITRLSGNKVRLKMVHVRQNKGGLKFRVGYGDDLDIIGVRYVDRKLKKWVDTELFKSQVRIGSNKGVLVDYILNLNDPLTAAAYDRSLYQIREYNYMGVVNPTVQFDELSERMVCGVNAIEELSKEDNTNVISLFRGKDNSKEFGWGLKLGNAIANAEYQRRTSNNDIVQLLEEEGEKKYVMRSSKIGFSTSFLFTLFEKTELNGTSLIHSTDDEKEFKGFVVTHSLTDKRYTENDNRNEIRKLKNWLPFHFNKIDFSKWKVPKTISNVQVDSMIVFSKESILKLPHISPSELNAKFEAYLAGIDDPNLMNFEDQNLLYGTGSNIYRILNPGLSLEERIDGFERLRSNPVHKEYVPGFLMTLYGEEDAKLVSVYLRMSSTNGSMVYYSYEPTELLTDFRKFNALDDHTNGDGWKLKLDMELLDAIEEKGF